MGIARLGFVTVYLSDPLVSGFTTAAACHVVTSQIRNIFGVATRKYSGPFKLIYVSRRAALQFLHLSFLGQLLLG